MPSAILIAGGSKRHLDEVVFMHNFLVQNAGLSLENIELIEAAYLDQKEFAVRLENAYEKLKGYEPILLYFSGHGGKKGFWCLNEDFKFSYEAVGTRLKAWNANVLFVNDCCYSYSAVPIFEKIGVGPIKVGVIASSDSDEKSYSKQLLSDLLGSWGRKEVYSPKQVYKNVEIMGGIIRSIDEPFLRTYHLRPRWKRIFDHLKYAGLETRDLAHDIIARWIVGFFRKCYLISAKKFGREVFIEKDPDAEKVVETIQESKRWGAVFDDRFFAKN